MGRYISTFKGFGRGILSKLRRMFRNVEGLRQNCGDTIKTLKDVEYYGAIPSEGHFALFKVYEIIQE